MKFIRTYWKLLFIILLVIIAGSVFAKNKAASGAESKIETDTARRQTFVKSLSSSGKTKADRSIDLKFQTSGRLSWVGVKEGDTVQAYQAIAKLDTREVQKTLEKTLHDYASERNDFEETWRVTYGGKTTTDAFNDTIKRILEKNQWDLEKAVLDVELKHLAVEYSTLITPLAGIVTHVDTPLAGINITPATAVFSIADPNSLIFEASVDETDVGSLTVGQSAVISLDAFPEATFSGTVTYVSYTAQQSSGGATVFPVKVTFTDPQSLRIGLNGDITIGVGQQDNVLTVPNQAVREDKDGIYVYRKTNDTYERTAVKTGTKNDDDTVITSGLSEGDTVVTKGFTSIPK